MGSPNSLHFSNADWHAKRIAAEGRRKSDARSSDLKRIGSAGAARIRTCWDLRLTLAIPFSRWDAHPFIVDPIPFPSRILDDLADVTEDRPQVQEPRLHPFLLAQSWRQQM